MAPRSGLYWLRDHHGNRYVTYCDFDEEGRSWTLVASVHENKMGVDGRCSPGDKWSNENGMDASVDPNEDTAWSDTTTFGDVTAATSADFKSPAYYSMQGRNVMIWHVREHTPVDELKEQAYLRYRTTDNVLARYGGNMYTLFRDHFNHKPGTSFPHHGPSSSVTYDKGSWAAHAFHLGPSVKSRIHGGRIQFRAVNLQKNSFALCPGGSIQTHSGYDGNLAELFCLGSNKLTIDGSDCGDFANWDRSGYGKGIDYSADQLLVKTTFLIFYG